MSQNSTAEEHLNLLVLLQNCIGKVLAPYEEFMLDKQTYYLSSSGFLYRKDFRAGEVRGNFCGYLDDEVWDHLENYINKGGAQQIPFLTDY